MYHRPNWRNMMAVNDTSVHLLMPGDLADAITRDASKRGLSRAELLRRLASRHLAEIKEKRHA
jgi:hypothetical protein